MSLSLRVRRWLFAGLAVYSALMCLVVGALGVVRLSGWRTDPEVWAFGLVAAIWLVVGVRAAVLWRQAGRYLSRAAEADTPDDAADPATADRGRVGRATSDGRRRAGASGLGSSVAEHGQAVGGHA